MICPNRECKEKTDCVHFEEHEKILTDNYDHCDYADVVCPSCIKELIEFISEKEMKI